MKNPIYNAEQVAMALETVKNLLSLSMTSYFNENAVNVGKSNMAEIDVGTYRLHVQEFGRTGYNIDDLLPKTFTMYSNGINFFVTFDPMSLWFTIVTNDPITQLYHYRKDIPNKNFIIAQGSEDYVNEYAKMIKQENPDVILKKGHTELMR